MNDANIDYTALSGSKILITGATGLIGKNIIKKIGDLNKHLEKPIKTVAVVRNKTKADTLFAGCNNIEYIISDIEVLEATDIGVDYIIHGASQTASQAFVEQPVETIMTALNGTRAVLEFARANPVKSMVYLSSMEVYGAPSTDELITEDHATNLDTMSVRSSYPESKRMCESMCTAYFNEYNVPAKVIRLTQTFGSGVNKDENRVFAQFAKSAIQKSDIILKTKGETCHSYLCTTDAVNAIFTVMLKGNCGDVYNASNESTYCSIYEMARLVANECAGGAINVRIDDGDGHNIYPKTSKMNLSSEKLRRLGWEPEMGLREMYDIMIGEMNENK